MKIQRLLIVLTLVNLALLIFTLAQARPTSAEGVSVLRGRALEIVDERGRVRASLNVLPAGTQPIGASEQAAGVSFAGPTNTKDTYVILEAKGTASSLRLRNEDGREQIVKP